MMKYAQQDKFISPFTNLINNILARPKESYIEISASYDILQGTNS